MAMARAAERLDSHCRMPSVLASPGFSRAGLRVRLEFDSKPRQITFRLLENGDRQVADRSTGLSRREHARSVLAQVPWFHHCKSETLDLFAARGRVRTFRAHNEIFRQGDPVDDLLVILSGRIEVSSSAPSGRKHILTHLETGKLLNLIPLLDGEPALYDIVAHSVTALLFIPGGLVLAALDDEPEFAHDMLELLSFRSRKLAGYISHEVLMPLPARCAHLLLTLVEYHGIRKPNGYLIDMKLSQEELAEMLGRSRQSVNREIRALEKAGLIETAYSQFLVRDVKALKEIADKY